MRIEAELPQREFLGVNFHQLSMEEMLKRLSATAAHGSFFYVVTPNVDHVLRLAKGRQDQSGDPELERAYRNARYCVCDSRVLARLARLFGVHLSVVPGSDLTAKLFSTIIEPGDLIGIVGGDDQMRERLVHMFPNVRFVQHVPPMGLYRNQAAMHDAAQFVAKSGAKFTFLAVGSPQSEALAHLIAGIPGAEGCGLCIGASIEFVTGQRKRAPLLVQRLSLEWCYRLVQEPRRLWRRYVIGAWKIVPIIVRWNIARTSRG